MFKRTAEGDRKANKLADKYTRGGEKFSGYNKPKKTPDHPSKSHAVLAKEGDQVKLIRFGQQGVSGSPKKEGESEAYANRRKSFKARHASNIKKGKMSAAYWAATTKWAILIPLISGIEYLCYATNNGFSFML